MIIRKNKKSICKEDFFGEKKARKNKSQKIKLALLVLLFLAVLGFAIFSFVSWRNTQEKIKALTTTEGQQKMVAEEIQNLVAKMNRLIVLPTGETPTLATITDIDALKKEQPFYEGAHNGDKILIYKNAKKGFIYDPVRDLIVNVGPVTFEPDNTATTNTPTKTSPTTNK